MQSSKRCQNRRGEACLALTSLALLSACAPASSPSSITSLTDSSPALNITALAVNPSSALVCIAGGRAYRLENLQNWSALPSPTSASSAAWVDGNWWLALPGAGLIYKATGVPQSISVTGSPALLTSRFAFTTSGEVLDFSGAFADTTKLLNPTPLRLPFLPAQPLTVLLDPGHGGPDPGALGNGLREDTLNLSMALRVKAWLERVPGVRVELTRLTNTVFSNDKRTDLSARARMSRGKTLLVSLHANAVPKASWNSQFGAETYYFGPLSTKPIYVPPLPPLVSTGAATTLNGATSSEADTAPAAIEKPMLSSEPATLISAPEASFAQASTPDDPQPVGLEPVVADGTLLDAAPAELPLEDPSFTAPLEQPAAATIILTSPAPVASASSLTVATPVTPTQIGVSLTLPGLDRMGASKMLASSVQSRLIHATRANNRGVRSADFYVIKNAECPAILVEIGFITHPIDAQMLKNANYLERVSYGVASGVTAYLSDIASP